MEVEIKSNRRHGFVFQTKETFSAQDKRQRRLIRQRIQVESLRKNEQKKVEIAEIEEQIRILTAKKQEIEVILCKMFTTYANKTA